MKETYPNSEREKKVVITVFSILAEHRGKRNRVKRSDLAVQASLYSGVDFDVTDRECRLAIEYLRNETIEGSAILSTSGMSGYWIAESMDEIMDHIKEEKARSISILKRIRNQEKSAKSLFTRKEDLPLLEFMNNIKRCEDFSLINE